MRNLTYLETKTVRETIFERANLYAPHGTTITPSGVEEIMNYGLANTQRMRNPSLYALADKFVEMYRKAHTYEEFARLFAIVVSDPQGEPTPTTQSMTNPEPEPQNEPEPEPQNGDEDEEDEDEEDEDEEDDPENEEDAESMESALDPLINLIADRVKEDVQGDIQSGIEEKMAEVDAKLNEIAQNIAPKEHLIKTPDHIVKVDGILHKEFDTVLQYVMANEPVYLYGPAGAGKNVLCQKVAEALGLDFYFSNAITQEHKLTGFIDAMGNYHETQFYKAFTKGGLFMLDEMDASIPEVLIILNSAIANRYFDFPTGRVQAHENFRVVSAGNTCGTGATYQYNGRSQLDGASLDRFAMIPIDYDKDIEMGCANNDKDLVTFVHALRKACEKTGIQMIISYRAITRLAKMMPVLGTVKALDTGLVKGMDKADLDTILGEMSLDSDNQYGQALRSLA